jgi:hypothetical protein
MNPAMEILTSKLEEAKITGNYGEVIIQIEDFSAF